MVSFNLIDDETNSTSCLLKILTNIRRKTVNLPTLEDMCISERTECIYAQIIAEEDMGEDYGKKIIIQEGVQFSGNNIF